MYKIAAENLQALFQKIAADQDLYLPVKVSDQVNFRAWSQDAEVCLDTLKTVKSPKDAFFPQSENLYTCEKEGKNITIEPQALQEKNFVVFGMKACDVQGVKVLDNISFTLGHDDKVAFVGANEQAITTLFKILVGEMEPDEGNYKWGVTTSQAYFPKDNTAEFDNDLTITDWLTQYSEIKDATYVRGFLGRMLFPGEDGIKRVRVLSGGEKVRCLLSKMMISGANILILDEPTNHLDMESITALNNGLIKFPGVILFTSHDHQFVQTTANRIMEILPNGTMIDKITTYDEYLASDEMAKKRHVFEINEEDASDN